MSLLEDARELADRFNMPEDGPCECWYCGALAGKIGVEHAPDCPWLSLPKIVAVLEAAERVSQEEPLSYGDCLYCDAEIAGREDATHRPDCRWVALVVALRGKGSDAS